MIFRVAILAIIIALATAQQLTQRDQKYILNFHNSARANPGFFGYPLPSGGAALGNLSWSDAIAAEAQAWVSQCKYQHSNQWAATKYGENIFSIISPNGTDFGAYNGYYLVIAMNEWANNGKKWDFNNHICYDSSCGSFTQMFSNFTTEFGCAAARCPVPKYGAGMARDAIFCMYSNFTQWTSVPPYNVDAQSSSSSSSYSYSSSTSGSGSSNAGNYFYSSGWYGGYSSSSSGSSSSSSSGSSSGSPTPAPTPAPTRAPAPTPAPTRSPFPTPAPTPSPTRAPTPAPTRAPFPTPSPTRAPTAAPSPSTSGGVQYPSIDYRGTNRVSYIKNQQQCGDCWAFSATALVESAYGLAHLSASATQATAFSEQCMLDCSTGGSCNGGWPTTALQGIQSKQIGLPSETAYPYTQAQGTCKSLPASASTLSSKCVSNGAYTCQTNPYTNSPAATFDIFYNALKTYGPIGIAVAADNAWQSYTGGVLQGTSTQIDHAVTIVGYNQPGNYWIVRNQWGTSWGQSGYIYISTGVTTSSAMYQSGAWWTLSN